MAKEIGLSSESLKISTVTGAAADTNMAVANITTDCELLSVLSIDWDDDTATHLTDDTAQASITSAGNIQSSTNNSGHAMLVIWLNHDKTV
jgi:hypothetical protein